jgi:hypothetical protein
LHTFPSLLFTLPLTLRTPAMAKTDKKATKTKTAEGKPDKATKVPKTAKAAAPAPAEKLAKAAKKVKEAAAAPAATVRLGPV